MDHHFIYSNMLKFKSIAAAVTVALSTLAATAPVAAATYNTYSDPVGAGVSLITLLCVCVVVVLILGLKIYLIVDATQRDYGNDNNMLLAGILILLFLGFPFGDIIYWALIMQKYPKKK